MFIERGRVDFFVFDRTIILFDLEHNLFDVNF